MAPLGRIGKVGMKAHEMAIMDMDLFYFIRRCKIAWVFNCQNSPNCTFKDF